MAVVNSSAVNVTNPYTVPVTMDDSKLVGGKVSAISDYVAVAAADDDTSTYRIARVHSSWKVLGIRKRNTAITAGTSYDVGLYYANGGALIDADAYASAVDLSSADVAGTDVAYEARALTKARDKVWQDAGLTSDPNVWMDIVFTANTVGSAAGTIQADVMVMKD